MVDATVDGVAAPATLSAGGAQVPAVPVGAALRVAFDQPVPRLENDVAARVYDILDRAQIEYEVKSHVQDVAAAAHPLHVRVSYVQAIALSRNLESSICEILLADAR